VTVFGFVLARKAEHSIALMCRVLEVSRSGYHAWAARPLSARGAEDARLSARIGELHALRRGVYGSPRIWADLILDDGERIGRKRVERLMRQAGLSGLITKKYKATTVRVPGVRVADDLLDRDFSADAPNQRWVADITYLRTWEGWLYLVAVQDLYSRRIVGQTQPNSTPVGFGTTTKPTSELAPVASSKNMRPSAGLQHLAARRAAQHRP
jgi:putative transposase